MKSKTTATILAFFLGGIGGHRFYLGQAGRGILYLIFCWTFVPAFIAFIDFIIFLTMSEESFNMKYNLSYMLLSKQQAQQSNIVINNTNHAGQIMPGMSVNQGENAASNNNKITKKNKAPKIDPFEQAGDEKYENYEFDGAIKDYLKSLNVRSNNPGVHFKLACLYSNLEQTDSAFFHVAKAVEKGFYDLEKIKTHDHLAFLRSQQPAYDNFVKNGFKLIKPVEGTDKLDLSDAIVSQIEKLAKMKDRGIINEDEFQAQKSKILA